MKYKFPCGCELEIVDENIKECDGLPGIKIDYYNLSDCQATWDLIGTGRTKGVFQLESNLGQAWAKRIMPRSLNEMSALISLIRPGCLRAFVDGKSMTQHYTDRKSGIEEIEYFHEALTPILQETYAVLTYQEQAMRIAQDIAGFNLQEADVLRKCVTKDTMFISKQRGWISIRELIKTGYKDDLFLVMDEFGKQQWKHITNIWSTGKHDVRQIETNSGMYVNATKYHQFLTNSGWKARLRLNENDYIVCAKEIEYEGQDIISPNLAFIIAGIITEGYFVENCHATFVNYDKKIMQWFTSRHEQCFGFGKTNQDPNVFTIKQHVKDRLAKYLKFGKSQDKEIPKEMMGATLGTTENFLSFMLGCDGGCCESSGQFEYTSKSKKLVHQIQLLLLRFGIRSYINIKTIEKYGKFYRLYVNDQIDQQKLYDKLSCWWPKDKQDTLKRIIDNKTYKNYTTDVIPSNIMQQMINQYPFIANYEGGSVYSQSISRTKFVRLANNTADSYWQTLATGKQQYQKIRSLNKCKRQQITYDFTVEGSDTPYIIANGLVIHNSIGKKDASLMTKVKADFLEGCKKTDIVTKEEAEEIFGWIRESQRYSFNKSHGITYGDIGYMSAYVKAHFPLHFFCAWLFHANEKMDPQQEMKELISDAKNFDITINPPSLKYLFNGDCGRFSIYKNNIYFGIEDIKKIGRAYVDRILEKVKEIEEKINKTIDQWHWYDFLIYFSDEISQTAVNNIVAVGALDYMGLSRSQKIHEYNVWRKLTTKERAWLKNTYNNNLSFKDNLQRLLTERTKTAKNRQAKILDIIRLYNSTYSTKDTAYSINVAELELLGVSITTNKLDMCNKNYQYNTSCKDILNGKDDKSILAVEIIKTYEHKIKNQNSKLNGMKMMFMSVEDKTGVLDNVVVFPEAYEKYKTHLIKGNTILLTGKKSYDNKDSFIVEEAKSI